jgi:hypothetical protein
MRTHIEALRPAPELVDVFFEELGRTALPCQSARTVGISIQWCDSQRAESKEFAARWENAIRQYREVLEKEIHRRGVEGVEEPVFYEGCEVAKVKKYSDRMLELKAKRFIPQYREKLIEATIAGGVVVVSAPAASAEEWAKNFDKPEPDEVDEDGKQNGRGTVPKT